MVAKWNVIITEEEYNKKGLLRGSSIKKYNNVFENAAEVILPHFRS